MKWLIASDIHGSAGCCRQLMQRFEDEKADKILLLGDLLYHGPRNALPEEYETGSVIALLNEKKDIITAVRGNCDAEVDQMVLEFPIMADSQTLFDGDLVIFATHGHMYDEYKLPPLKEMDVILCGHTHVPALRDHGRYIYMNPGSVSIPKGGSEKSYMTLENGIFTWKTLEGETYRRFDIRSRREEEDEHGSV